MDRSQVLSEAAKAVGQRGLNYGSPAQNFYNIAELWTAYKGVYFDHKDVGMMMILLKIARLKHSDHDDSFVDVAGYAAVTAEAVYDTEGILHLQGDQQSTEPMTQD